MDGRHASKPKAAGEGAEVAQTDRALDPRRVRLRELCRDIAANCNLPPMPKVAARALALTSQGGVTAEELGRILSVDPALAVRVLSIARSVLYCRRQPVRTVQEAIVTVGFERLREVLIVAAARTLHGADDAVAHRLWAHALATAFAADEMRPPGEPRGGESFIAALLHDIGRLVFHLSDPTGAALGHADEATERSRYGVTHAALGGYLADTWSIDIEVANAIFEHHVYPAYGLAGRIATADWIAHAIGFGSTPGTITRPDVVDGPPGDLAHVIDRVEKTFATERALFD